MNNSVTIQNLTKKFNDGDSPALSDISLNIQKGHITGLVGPDGAGKTTLLRLIIGLLKPTIGEIKTLDLDTISQKNLLNQKIGYMSQKNGIYEDLSVLENMTLFASLKGVKESDISELFSKLLKFTDLTDFQDRLAGKLSGGMKQKLGLACALLGDPEILVLDEPSVGVDPISRKELIKIVKDLQSEGMTIIWSTAYLDEAQNFDDCILLDNGNILYNGDPNLLTEKMNGRVFLAKDGENIRKYLETIKQEWKGVVDATIQSNAVRVVFDTAIKNSSNSIEETTPRFEDAVIEVLGGINKQESKLAKSYREVKTNDDTVIEAIDLVKKYGDFYAVKRNTFDVKKGEIFGLLGPNGAGKSTTFKMLCGLATPTSGSTKIMGTDIKINPTKSRSYLGYMAQKFSLYESLTVTQNLEFFSGIYGLFGDEKKEKIKEMIQIFKFKKYIDTNAGELPLGYKQRLSLSCATMHCPPILFLDEPTSGVDPLTRRDFWNHINGLAEKGVTILVTTHFMSEAEYCDRINLFYRGETIAMGTPSELKNRVGPNATMEDTFIKLIEEFEANEVKK